MSGYIAQAEKIAKEKLEMYSELLQKIHWFKDKYQ